jgi:diguanylate cyclase (GGDEF)-like protein
MRETQRYPGEASSNRPLRTPLSSPPARRLLLLAALSAIYFIAAKFGLTFAFVNASATAIWPAAGIALAAFLILGYGAWPAILVGAFLANLTTQDSVTASIGIGIGNTLEGLIGAYLVNRFANGCQFATRPRHVFLFAGFGAFVSTTVGASVGVTSLVLTGLAREADVGPIWLTWWLGDAAGALIVAPAIVLWSSAFHLELGFRRSLEAGALVVSLSMVAFIVFHGITATVGAEHVPLAFLCTPFLFWAAFRFGRRGVATCVLIVSWIAIWGTLRGLGPLVRPSPNESLLLLQAHLAVEAVTMLAVGAVVWQLRQAEHKAQQLAVTDSLTGLSNHRRLMTTLTDEIKRSQRTNHPLAVLLLDVDGLKRVNDGHGHLAGNRALCRVADALRASVRTTDTVVRFGGDEFACVLPDTSEAGAADLANRLGDRLASDLEQPRLSVSLGWAVYPRDGASPEPLLSAADRALYAAKATRQTNPVPGRQSQIVQQA